MVKTERMSIKDFSDLYHAKQCEGTSLPAAYVPRKKFSDSSANALTDLVIEFINYNGGYARRISVEGRTIAGKKFTNVMGETKQLPSKRIKSSMTKGSSDISCIYKGQALEVEVKFGRDKLSEAQLNYAERVRESGGFYIVARDFAQFHDRYGNTV